ncbi:hypothetical protein O6H91_12G017400 [Diphasiastrum complanatum]|uniref:Uncharacterized protein n=1 Tax=Diphasiastrum complanatum TaxID=34168 RepID=A0ACC2BZM6_DIPCM|nr:hypothetical protein O6H91_12G017400 [Diphasiastrum complanatum]
MPTLCHCRPRPSLYRQTSREFSENIFIKGALNLLMPSHLPLRLTDSSHPFRSKSIRISSTGKPFVSQCEANMRSITSMFDQQEMKGYKSTNKDSSDHKLVADAAIKSNGRAWHVVVNTLKASNREAPSFYQSSSLSFTSRPAINFPSQLQLPSVEQLFFVVGFLSCMRRRSILFFWYCYILTLGAFLAVLAIAIPTLHAMRKAALSMEKLANMAIEELPGTMAAVRLSSMEISDLTLELHDLSQEISEGVKSSARAVKAAEVGIRQMGVIAASQTLAILQERASVPVEAVRPVVASAAESTRQAVAQAQRAVVNMASNPHALGWLRKITQKGQPEANMVAVLDVKPDQRTRSTINEDKADKVPVDLE